MGKVDRLRNRGEPFAALFWGLGIVLVLYLPTLDPARMSLYGQSWFNSQRRRIDALFSYLGMLFIYGWENLSKTKDF